MDSDIEEAVNDLGYAMQELRDNPTDENYESASLKSMDINNLIDSSFPDDEQYD